MTDQPSLPHVELLHVGKRFQGARALSDVSLSIQRGAIHALIGENGAGKSTLGKIIAGVIRPDEGELWVEGRQNNERVHALLRAVDRFGNESNLKASPRTSTTPSLPKSATISLIAFV